ncbi:phage transcriptional regulator AlpA [Moraxella bovoculi 237]|uniref:Phage transcriptional regulator AlpA n=1 Tax=Moraxella bovoculi 237 TaxID=743974 RepID=A0A066ULX5_9GAMM|nr:AlpA family phage regulatory protein [Moraxella bovoculi]KDN25168.1 phage transcriptional regulator AlpA [Moraxella bovoculi 237]
MTPKTQSPKPTPCDTFPRQGISRIKAVCMMTGLSKSTIYNWVKAGKFPAPIKLSPTMTAWRNSDVLDWINSLETVDDYPAISQTTSTKQ